MESNPRPLCFHIRYWTLYQLDHLATGKSLAGELPFTLVYIAIPELVLLNMHELTHPCDKDTSQLDPWPFSLRDLAHGPVGPMTHQPFLALDK